MLYYVIRVKYISVSVNYHDCMIHFCYNYDPCKTHLNVRANRSKRVSTKYYDCNPYLCLN